MPIYMNGKKIKDLHYAGKKIKEAWYNGKKVYSSFTLPPQWNRRKNGEYQAGDEVYSIYSINAPVVYIFRRTGTQFAPIGEIEYDRTPRNESSSPKSTRYWEYVGSFEVDPFPPEGWDASIR